MNPYNYHLHYNDYPTSKYEKNKDAKINFKSFVSNHKNGGRKKIIS
jgi:hypothetical protein